MAMGNPRKNPVTDQQILDAYQEYRSGYRVADVLGISETTVYRVLANHEIKMTGIEDYRKGIATFSPEQGQELRRLYEEGFFINELTRRFGGSACSVRTAIKKAGGTFRPCPCPTIKDGELEEIRRLHASGMGQVKISLAIGRSQSFVSRVMRNNDIIPHTNGGDGRFLDGGGYYRVFVKNDDPMACMRNNAGYALEHRLVMARKLGRPLLPTETVHHINSDRTDNRPENLQLRQGRHGKGVVLCCRDCGSRNIGPVPIEEED